MTALGPRAEILRAVDQCVDDFGALLKEAAHAAIVTRDSAVLEAAFTAFAPLTAHVLAAVAAGAILDANEPPPAADVQNSAHPH